MKFYLDRHLKPYFTTQESLFDQVMSLKGERFRAQKGRVTERVRIGDRYYFIKKHTGVGFKEIIKNILQLRLPIISAKNEWRALSALRQLKIGAPLVVGFGERGFNPARKQSFVLMEELPCRVSLEDIVKHWQKTPPKAAYKRKLIAKVADIARVLHQHGINHRDFYICHFILNTHESMSRGQAEPSLSLIDLHRAEIRLKVPQRWQIKDLAGLYFSSKDSGLTERDYLRFIARYRGMHLRDCITQENNFWEKVRRRGDELYRKHIVQVT